MLGQWTCGACYHSSRAEESKGQGWERCRLPQANTSESRAEFNSRWPEGRAHPDLHHVVLRQQLDAGRPALLGVVAHEDVGGEDEDEGLARLAHALTDAADRVDERRAALDVHRERQQECRDRDAVADDVDQPDADLLALLVLKLVRLLLELVLHAHHPPQSAAVRPRPVQMVTCCCSRARPACQARRCVLETEAHGLKPLHGRALKQTRTLCNQTHPKTHQHIHPRPVESNPHYEHRLRAYHPNALPLVHLPLHLLDQRTHISACLAKHCHTGPDSSRRPVVNCQHETRHAMVTSGHYKWDWQA